MAKKISPKMLVVLVLIVVALWFLTRPAVSKKMGASYYTPTPGAIAGVDMEDDETYAPANLASADMNLGASCAMNSGVGLSSSLLPREMASQEDYGQFAPDDILKGQNFLDPRSQIGWPETIGGSLRNANQQLRADPPNPKQGYVWQNSTIVPDIMQRDFCNV
jgi:hypothetical protein